MESADTHHIAATDEADPESPLRYANPPAVGRPVTSLKPGAPTGSEGRHELEEDVLAALARVIRDVVGEEHADSMEVTRDTTFQTDPDLERIEFVAPADRARLRYGSSVVLVAFLATMHLTEAARSSVGDVVYLIADSLSGASHG
ncbi:acyl carrier protein [Parafrankia sp. FMc6]|uniref:acyl carrier protein n=1 Tax=Parafrankia soli TaxID=2599596 RepID=UPI0034D6FA07